ALRPLRVSPWPHDGPIVVRERRDLHVFNAWRHLGTMRTESEALDAMNVDPGEFDRSVYACLVRSLPAVPPERIHALQSRESASISRQRLHGSEKEKADSTCRPFEIPGGDEEDRTPDLRIANAALSQLSYVPRGGEV